MFTIKIMLLVMLLVVLLKEVSEKFDWLTFNLWYAFVGFLVGFKTTALGLNYEEEKTKHVEIVISKINKKLKKWNSNKEQNNVDKVVKVINTYNEQKKKINNEFENILEKVNTAIELETDEDKRVALEDFRDVVLKAKDKK